MPVSFLLELLTMGEAAAGEEANADGASTQIKAKVLASCLEIVLDL